MKNCPNCGTPQEGDALFCDACGNRFPAKARVCTLCVIGFICSLVSLLCPAVLFGSSIFIFGTDRIGTDLFKYILEISCVVNATAAIAGLIISIIGTRKARRQKLNGIGLGITGIVISALMIFLSIAGVVLIVLFIALLIAAIGGSNAKNPNFNADPVRYGNYEVRIDENKDIACLTTWYWSGDPGDTVISIPDETPGGAKITYIGASDYRRPRFSVSNDDSAHDYCLTTGFKNSEAYHSDVFIVPDDPAFFGIQPDRDVNIETLIFTVKIGSEVEYLNFYSYDLYMITENDDGVITIYKYYYYFECSEDNEKFFSKDGKLYLKKTLEPVYVTDSEIPENTDPTYVVATEPDTGITYTGSADARVINLGSGTEIINLWAYSDDVIRIVEKYIKMNPEFGEQYTVKCTIIVTDGGNYQSNLTNALVAGGDTAPDIYFVDSDSAVYFTQGDMSGYAAGYKELGIDVDTKIKEAEIAPYIVDIGSRNGEVVGLSYWGTSGVMIYNSKIAKEVFGTNDPAEIEKITGAGSGSWDKFLEAAEILKTKGYAATAGYEDICTIGEKAADEPWVTDGCLTSDPQRELYLDIAKTIKDCGYSNNAGSWTEDWYKGMKGESEKKVFAYFGPAWLINYAMIGNCGGDKAGEGTFGQWRVCAPPVGFYLGGTWVLANKNTDNRAGVVELIEWITLDTSETGLQYLWANGLVDLDGNSDTITMQDAVASSAVMARSEWSSDFCGGQNLFPAFIAANKYSSGKGVTQYDLQISRYWKNCIEDYARGIYDKKEAIERFKKSVSEEVFLG